LILPCLEQEKRNFAALVVRRIDRYGLKPGTYLNPHQGDVGWHAPVPDVPSNLATLKPKAADNSVESKAKARIQSLG